MPSSSNNDNPEKKNKLQSKLSDILLRHEDTFVDVFLDRLRDTSLPAIVEVLLSYWIAVVCLLYYGYVFLHRVVLRIRKQHVVTNEPPQIPLVTESKDWAGTYEAREVYQELRHELHQVSRYNTTWTDTQLINLVRSNTKVRRLVSRLLCHCRTEEHEDDDDDKTMAKFRRQLLKLWPQLLELPPLPKKKKKLQAGEFLHSLIIPAHKEQGAHLVRTLQHAQQHCSDPSQVTVVIVDAGENTDLEQVQNLNNDNAKWGSFRVVPFKKGGGRGPALNEGALCAHATLLTFLHSDTLLPHHWDVQVQDALLMSSNNNNNVHHACAFSFGFDLSKPGLESHRRYPWGISAIALLANLRAYYLNLPYGDQVLSMPSEYFHYVGGFPAQPILEDYELMDLFRQRAQRLGDQTERLQVIPRPAVALSHPRRYQAYGVVYVTLVNVLNVFRYRQGWKPQEIYEYYYGRPRKKTD